MIKQIFIVCIGTMIAASGVQLIVVSGMGTDSLSTLILGLLEHTQIPFGRWSQMFSVLFLIITFYYRRELINIGSVINALLFGETIQYLSNYIYYDNNRWIALNGFYLLLGFILMAAGTALYLKGNLGAGPLEGLMFCLSDKIKLPYKYSRILIDFSFVFIGAILGSSFGVGTLFAVFALGPLIQYFSDMMRII